MRRVEAGLARKVEARHEARYRVRAAEQRQACGGDTARRGWWQEEHAAECSVGAAARARPQTTEAPCDVEPTRGIAPGCPSLIPSPKTAYISVRPAAARQPRMSEATARSFLCLQVAGPREGRRAVASAGQARGLKHHAGGRCRRAPHLLNEHPSQWRTRLAAAHIRRGDQEGATWCAHPEAGARPGNHARGPAAAAGMEVARALGRRGGSLAHSPAAAAAAARASRGIKT